MNDIRISPGAQQAMMLGTVAAVGLAVAAQYPEIKRYLKIKAM
jgi:hypothetical protein